MNWDEKLLSAMSALDEIRVLDCIKGMKKLGYTREEIQRILNDGSVIVGQLFENGDYFIADLIVSGMIYQHALSLLTPSPKSCGGVPEGRIVIGVVEGDIHDIGKDIVVSLLRSEGFEVIDLGVDVKPSRFVHALSTYKPDIMLLSGLLPQSAYSVSRTMKIINGTPEKSSVKIFIGGQCASQQLAEDCSADGWGYEPTTTLDFCKQVMKRIHEEKNA